MVIEYIINRESADTHIHRGHMESRRTLQSSRVHIIPKKTAVGKYLYGTNEGLFDS